MIVVTFSPLTLPYKQVTENSFQAVSELWVNPSLTHTEADNNITVSRPKFRDFEILKSPTFFILITIWQSSVISLKAV